jgi:predicted transcriptional regulator
MSINLKKIRRDLNLTVPEMARLAKVSKSTIDRHIRSTENMHPMYVLWYKKVFSS